MKPDEKPNPSNAKRWTGKEKLRILETAARLEGEELGAFLRHEGLHDEDLKRWREAAAGALESAEAASSGALTAKGRRQLKVAKNQVKALERELRRKDKALAEAAAMLMLEKNFRPWAGTSGISARATRTTTRPKGTRNDACASQ